MPNITDSFLAALQEAYRASFEVGGIRGTNRIKPVHQWLSDHFKKELGEGYTVYSLRKSGFSREIKASGRYYDKDIDIGVQYRSKLISGMGFKFVISNYKQNSNNFFENMLGETANIKRGEIVYGSLMVVPAALPYKAKSGSVKKYEEITEHNLKKYLKLFQDGNFPHKPDTIGFVLVDVDYNNKAILGLSDVERLDFSDEVAAFLKNSAGLEQCLSGFIQLTKEAAKAHQL